MTNGTVYWITGLSGAGKTTIGKLLYNKLKGKKNNVVFLDGDLLREVFGNDLGYSKNERYISAMRNARLCKLFSDQGIDVVCATISMFNIVRAWNRENIMQYKEIYLKVSLDVLSKRNQKGLYYTEADHLVGLGVEMEEPENPDVLVENNGILTPLEVLDFILGECS
jgi:adenylylsulfate kinase-like enzyme